MTDIDDTLTRDGAIEPAALAALQRLADAGLPVIAITGRPMGWSQPFAAAWPVAAIVAENGAVALRQQGGQLQIDYVQSEAERTLNSQRLAHAAQTVLREVPGAQLAQDSAGRVTDIAIDHSEFTHLPPEAIAQVCQLLQGQGLTVTVSSIHINAWFGEHDKASGARWMVQHLWGRDLQAELDQWVYVGDSTNDQAMFRWFTHSVGVANLLRFADQLQHWPTWLASAERGQGFAQVADSVLAARGVPG
jgi:HAD superfamily hydrolase (TIGR01484 family)